MEFSATKLSGAGLINYTEHADERGAFWECFRASWFEKENVEFVQDNFSLSKKGVLRGLHLQTDKPQGKLVTVLNGTIIDVCVDLRRHSDTFGQFMVEKISHLDKRAIWVPPGMAHGFLATEESTLVHYKCTANYSPDSEITLLWDDETLSIPWKDYYDGEFLISEKDRKGCSFKRVVEAVEKDFG